MGTPVILIHGMWCHGGLLSRLDELLSARTYECHRPTLPAHEAGPVQADAVARLSIRDYAEALKDYIASQNFSQPPVLVGHSMGGLLAQMLATEIPTAALVLLTPASPRGINAVVPRTFWTFLGVLSRFGFWRRAHKLSPERTRQCAVNGLHAAQQEKIIKSLVYESGRMLSEIAFWWADRKRATRVEAKAVRCPVYVVSAGQDWLTPPSVVKKVAARYANATHRHWPDRGHWVIDDIDTEDMVREIDSWLRPILLRARRPSVPLVASNIRSIAREI